MSSDLEIAAFIGLDWADQQHVIRLRVTGSAPVEAQLLDQKPETLRSWIGQLRQRFGGRPVAIALEQSRGSLLYALMNVDFLLLYPVNPQNLAQFRKAFYPSGAKDDPQDALLLLEMLEKHRDRLRVWVPDDADTLRSFGCHCARRCRAIDGSCLGKRSRGSGGSWIGGRVLPSG